MNLYRMFGRPEPQQMHRMVVNGISESVDALIFDAKVVKRPVLVIAQDMMNAERFSADLEGLGHRPMIFPSKELLTHRIYSQSKDVLSGRAALLTRMLEPDFSEIVITTVKAISQKVIRREHFQEAILNFRLGESYALDQILTRLQQLGYERETLVQRQGEFSLRGDILDVFTLQEEHPLRLEFFGDELDAIRRFDEASQISFENIQEAHIAPVQESFTNEVLESKLKRALPEALIEQADFARERDRYFALIGEAETIFEYVDFSAVVLLEEQALYERLDQLTDDYLLRMAEALERGEAHPGEELSLLDAEALRTYISARPQFVFNRFSHLGTEAISWNTHKLNPYRSNLQKFIEDLVQRQKQGYRQLILLSEKQELLEEELKHDQVRYLHLVEEQSLAPGEIALYRGYVKSGFIDESAKLALYTQEDLFGLQRKKQRKAFGDHTQRIDNFFDLKQGDYVVHIHHGIAKYMGLVKKKVELVERDYLSLEYASGDKLFIPTDHIDLIQRYIGGAVESVKLTRLSTNEWKRKKERARRSIEDLTEELLELYAQREQAVGYAFSEDTPWQREFEADFRYEETPDQLRCVAEIKADMEKIRPMDRLLCGDVGFGKTEVALRAVFKAVMDSKQAAMLVPTTILAEQHYQTMLERFKAYPIKIAMLSRLVTPAKQRQVKDQLKRGLIDVVVGTHALLSENIAFKDLGLLVVDEEQRFGVKHKEKIRKLKHNVDTLAMSATPIPRTLNMSLSGIRDMSILQDPPEDRYPIQTFITEYDERIIREAILREVERKGQVYYIYNRVEDMEHKFNKLSQLIPEVRMLYAHGQMRERALEDAVLNFIDKQADVLLASTIVETGMDISNVNTIIIEDAQNLGLSQLYQLRGRVGRTNRVAYAYLFYPRQMMLKNQAMDRLNTIKEFTDFGSGFKIAIRDLEIRGSGNLLGASQSGHFEEVGYELYMQMLREKMEEIRGITVPKQAEVSVDFDLSAYLPDTYIQDAGTKMEIYRKIRAIDSAQDRIQVQDEIIDRFGLMPAPVESLIDISYLRSLAEKIPFTEVTSLANGVRLKLDEADLPTAGFFQKIFTEMRDVKLELKHKPHLFVPYRFKVLDRDKDLTQLIRTLEKMVEFKNRELS